MLDNETKRRIDTCRDILVGKVPDPKSQVEQISIALIYKFMDDMDREAVEMGGKPGFFTGDYTKYAWSKIFDPRLGGFEMLALYSEAITRMSQNPGIPQLFRDIFKNAYLPYRDPETLKLFLKSINDFTYDHSERLGDAFEYLLSVLGSQGDAGQFRTPRHIIDFMVEVVKPQKHETILDPACGTAGFLISSYKHIVKTNTKKMPGDQLKTEERKKLLTNFKGYDISPDMVRLSLVNLYLHGFVQPQVMEYDTLTSEDRWNEYADVILANPPFMSPKGGIKPHKRFSVQSNRSEVLFVDYIAEHLTPTGRAAVIVPEGIIFQSANAYKQLRKYLVDEGYLYAVVSLPAGVFNPYSGVKTSILLMDRTIAKKAGSVLFIKIDNDGFDLGAQRRSHDKNDLPGALELLNQYVDSVRAGKVFDADGLNGNAILVAKEKLAENGEYNLTGERYRVTAKRAHQKWPMVELGVIAEFTSGLWKGEKEPYQVIKILRNTNFTKDGRLNLQDIAELPVEINKLKNKLLKYGDIILEKSGGGPTQPVGRVAFFDIIDNETYSFSNFTSRLRLITNEIIPKYCWLCLTYLYQKGYTENLQKRTSGIRNLDIAAYKNLLIPLPPLEVQREIVVEIEGYQKIIDGARQVVENWKPQIDIDPEWPIAKLEEITNQITDGTHKTPVYTDSGVPFLRVTDLTESNDSKKFISNSEHEELIKRCKPEAGDILYSKNGTIGVAKMIDWDYEFSIFVSLALIKPQREKVLSKYLELLMNTNFIYNQATAHSKSGTVTNLHLVEIKQFKVPLPSLDIQKQIIENIEHENKAINACRELIKIYEDKIKQVIDKIWVG